MENKNQEILLKDSGISKRALNMAQDLTKKKLDKITLRDLCNYSEKELLAGRYIGKKTMTEITEALQSRGLKLKPSPEDLIQLDTKKALMFLLHKLYLLEKTSFDKNARDFREYLRFNHLLINPQ